MNYSTSALRFGLLLVVGWLTSPANAAESPWTVSDESFRAVVKPGAQLEFLAGGFNGCEGGGWFPSADEPDGGYFRFGAVHTNVAFRWDVKNGLHGIRSPSDEASAFQPYPDGSVIIAEQTTRRLVREKDGKVTVLVDSYEGKKLNRPNDLVVKRDGTIWFTDPDYLFKQRPKEVKEQPGQYVFRFVPTTGELTAVIKDLKTPNGISFSPDEAWLYVGDTPNGTVDRWPVNKDGTLGARQPFVKPRTTMPDGVTCDQAGNVWIASNKAVEIFSPEGKPLAELTLPGKRPSCITFGGKNGEWVYLCTREAAYRIAINPVK